MPAYSTGAVVPVFHPVGNPGANLKSISHGSYLFEVAFVWKLTKENYRFAPGLPPGRGAWPTDAKAALGRKDVDR